MSVELYYVYVYGLLIVATTLVQQLFSLANFGIMPVCSSREGVPFSDMTRRLERTILNCVIALAVIAPAMLALVKNETSNANTILAVQVFFWACLVYVITYGLNINGVRSVSWIASLLSILYLYWSKMSNS